jgi:hypothetical protein
MGEKMQALLEQMMANADKKPDPNWQRSEASKKRLMFEEQMSPLAAAFAEHDKRKAELSKDAED